MSTNEKGSRPKVEHTPRMTLQLFRIGCASAFINLANSGLFKTIRIGNMIRISRKSFEDWLKIKGLDDETEIE